MARKPKAQLHPDVAAALPVALAAMDDAPAPARRERAPDTIHRTGGRRSPAAPGPAARRPSFRSPGQRLVAVVPRHALVPPLRASEGAAPAGACSYVKPPGPAFYNPSIVDKKTFHLNARKRWM